MGAGSGYITQAAIYRPAAATTYTADQWNQLVACVHAAGHLGAVPGTQGRGIGVITAAAVDDIRSCAAQYGIDLGSLDLAAYVGRTMTDLRNDLGEAGVIPKTDILGLGGVDGWVHDLVSGLGDVALRGVFVVGSVVLVLLGARRLFA